MRSLVFLGGSAPRVEKLTHGSAADFLMTAAAMEQQARAYSGRNNTQKKKNSESEQLTNRRRYEAEQHIVMSCWYFAADPWGAL